VQILFGLRQRFALLFAESASAFSAPMFSPRIASECSDLWVTHIDALCTHVASALSFTKDGRPESPPLRDYLCSLRRDCVQSLQTCACRFVLGLSSLLEDVKSQKKLNDASDAGKWIERFIFMRRFAVTFSGTIIAFLSDFDAFGCSAEDADIASVVETFILFLVKASQLHSAPLVLVACDAGGGPAPVAAVCKEGCPSDIRRALTLGLGLWTEEDAEELGRLRCNGFCVRSFV
jgi:hypothetical protein